MSTNQTPERSQALATRISFLPILTMVTIMVSLSAKPTLSLTLLPPCHLVSRRPPYNIDPLLPTHEPYPRPSILYDTMTLLPSVCPTWVPLSSNGLTSLYFLPTGLTNAYFSFHSFSPCLLHSVWSTCSASPCCLSSLVSLHPLSFGYYSVTDELKDNSSLKFFETKEGIRPTSIRTATCMSRNKCLEVSMKCRCNFGTSPAFDSEQM